MLEPLESRQGRSGHPGPEVFSRIDFSSVGGPVLKASFCFLAQFGAGSLKGLDPMAGLPGVLLSQQLPERSRGYRLMPGKVRLVEPHWGAPHWPRTKSTRFSPVPGREKAKDGVGGWGAVFQEVKPV